MNGARSFMISVGVGLSLKKYELFRRLVDARIARMDDENIRARLSDE
jgi:hypothetical protein